MSAYPKAHELRRAGMFLTLIVVHFEFAITGLLLRSESQVKEEGEPRRKRQEKGQGRRVRGERRRSKSREDRHRVRCLVTTDNQWVHTAADGFVFILEYCIA